MNRTYLLLGSNMGKSEKQLAIAQDHIEKKIGNVFRASSIYQTAAWGKTDQPDFLNRVLIVETRLTAVQTMQCLLSIEKKMGRALAEKYAPRIIDIDILFFNREIINGAALTIPHPQLQNRRFVLVPLNELSPRLIHPVLKRSIHNLLKECRDKLDVKKF